MARATSKTLTEAEQRVMDVLWRCEEASVREVADALSQERDVAYNTVLTILGILHKKKYVKFRRDGRAHIYHAVISESEAQREAVDTLVSRFFGGSSNAFAQYLVDEKAIDPDELRRLKSMTQKARRKGN